MGKLGGSEMIQRVVIPSYRKIEDFNESYTLKKSIQTPEFPPKKVLRWNSKVLEQRRLGLQNYIQGIFQGETVPKSILKFLNINFVRTGSEESVDQFSFEHTLTHQPTIGFPQDAFLLDNCRSSLPDIVSEGVIQGLYSGMDDVSIR